MNKPFKEIKDLISSTVKKSKIEILGVCFLLTPMASEASLDFSEHSFQNVEVVEEATSVTASNGTVEFQLSDNQDKWNVILDELAEYPDNWDGEGARAINSATIDTCRQILEDTARYESLLDDIYPTEFGTICLQWHSSPSDGLVNAEVASDRMAFYAHEPGKELYSLNPVAFGKEPIDQLVAAIESLS